MFASVLYRLRASPVMFCPDSAPIPSANKPLTRKLRMGLAVASLFVPQVLTAAPVSYNSQIRPLLSDNCFNCHGPDSGSRKAGLRLDSFEAATSPNKDGFAAVIPGKPEESEIIKRALSQDPDEIMPPPESHKSLKPEQIALLKQWVSEGAKYEPHWSFIAPVRPALPSTGSAGGVTHPIDKFIRASLDANQLQPSPEADRRTLIRRVSLDLTGLPPSPETVEAFVRDPDPEAYEKWVDRLLDSPAWGEHRTRYWLDYARYADTHGIHFDNYREMWHYRQNVTEAFNRNQPFDQFTTEQIAGDLLPQRTLEQQIASGFNRCNITTNEGGAIAEEYLVLYARDRVEATSAVWMGLTTGCAVCHDHKFDPVSQKEFYQLAAFFNNTTQNAMDGNIAETPPMVVVASAADRPRWEALPNLISTARRKVDDHRNSARTGFLLWLQQAKSDQFAEPPTLQDWQLRIPLTEKSGPNLTVTGPAAAPGSPSPAVTAGVAALAGPLADPAYQITDGSTVEVHAVATLESDKPFSFGAWIRIPKENPTGAIFARMDPAASFRGWDLYLEGGRVGTHLISSWQDDALKVLTRNPLPVETWHHVLLTYDGSKKAAGVVVYVNGKPEALRVDVDRLQGSITNPSPLPVKLGQRQEGSRINGLGLQDVRIYQRKVTAAEVQGLAQNPVLATLLAKTPETRTPEEENRLFQWYLTQVDGVFPGLQAEVATLEQERSAIRSRSPVTHVMQEKEGTAEAWVLTRGAYDQRAEKVTPATPAVLPPMPPELPRNRLGLAQWLLRPEHPLTARVTVNRFWQEVFGTGLVASSGDFGISGDTPTHPELLDWLAVEFREKGWNVKEFFRLIVTSATYRQDARVTPALLARDPSNRYLARGPRFRMDAEMVRDYALSTSGLLVQKIGGPSVRPYQPDGIWDAVAMPESNTRFYKADSGENLYRRSMYTFWKRAAPPASMDTFNAPARENCTIKRERTNTPLQALTTLNDIQFIEAARALAQQVLRENPASPLARLDSMAKRVLCRSLTQEEQVILLASWINLHREYEAQPGEATKLITTGDSKPDPTLAPVELAAWTMVANQILNLDETLNK